MENHIGANNRFSQLGEIANISLNELSARRQVGRQTCGVYLRREIIEYANCVPRFEQQVCGMGTDKTGAAGNENRSCVQLDLSPDGSGFETVIKMPICTKLLQLSELWMNVTGGEMSCEQGMGSRICMQARSLFSIHLGVHSCGCLH